jgi:hypothetical protein
MHNFFFKKKRFIFLTLSIHNKEVFALYLSRQDHTLIHHTRKYLIY